MARKQGIPQVGDLVWYEDPQGLESDTYWVIDITEQFIYTITEWKNGSGHKVTTSVNNLTLE